MTGNPTAPDELDRLFAWLVRAIRDQRPEYLAGAFEVGELLSFVPYKLVRADVGVATNDDYGHALTRLLAGERGFIFVDELMQDDLQHELKSQVPDLQAYRAYLNTRVTLAQERVREVLDALGPAVPRDPVAATNAEAKPAQAAPAKAAPAQAAPSKAAARPIARAVPSATSSMPSARRVPTSAWHWASRWTPCCSRVPMTACRKANATWRKTPRATRRQRRSPIRCCANPRRSWVMRSGYLVRIPNCPHRCCRNRIVPATGWIEPRDMH